jgi:predicted ArsR family transcriptional regulator
MSSKLWRQRMLSTTRGQVLSLLRREPRTVNDLARALDLTDNGVRIHLSGLERDGLVEQEGVRRGSGKPAYVYRLTAEAETLFPKAYATVLGEILAYLRDQHGSAGLEAMLRSVGRRTGERAIAGSAPLRDRVDAAVDVFGALGGLAAVEEAEDEILIRGLSCPLSAIVGQNAEACALAEELMSGVIGSRVVECCDRSGTPRCGFRVPRG